MGFNNGYDSGYEDAKQEFAKEKAVLEKRIAELEADKGGGSDGGSGGAAAPTGIETITFTNDDLEKETVGPEGGNYRLRSEPTRAQLLEKLTHAAMVRIVFDFTGEDIFAIGEGGAVWDGLYPDLFRQDTPLVIDKFAAAGHESSGEFNAPASVIIAHWGGASTDWCALNSSDSSEGDRLILDVLKLSGDSLLGVVYTALPPSAS